MNLQKQSVKRLTPSDAAELHKLLQASGEDGAEICDNSVGNIYMWEATLATEKIGEDRFCIAEHYEGDTYFALRKADGDYKERIEALLLQFGAPLHLCSMTEAEITALHAIYGERFSCEGEDGAADYIYDASDLRTLSGKRFHAQRNHLNAFLREYQGYTFLPYTAEAEAEVLAFFDAYEESVDDRTESAKKESLACRRLLPLLPTLGLDARVFRIDRRICGFVVMERVGNTLMIHIEKALTAYRGIYPMLVQLEANAYPDVRFVNREEDDGNEGLRRSKMSYNPIEVKQKYIGRIE
ncbi:MAG: DUF2156 domain-containing protein [Clostridia bacterium]|nr:DUF2156 domain-containing protein [Clostridia bacterium]